MADENEDDLLRSVALQNAQAVLLARQRAEQELIQAKEALEQKTEELRESEEEYRALFDSIDEGFCVIEALFDDADNALDYRFLEVNRVFEKQTGISNAVGRRMREIAPALEEHWFQIYGHIALTGESRRFENPAVALGRFYDVYAFRVGRPEERQVAVLFNDMIVVSVADTGPGIPQEHLSKIFDRFWRTPGTKQKGSGLGLSIAKGIVDAHGGTIWAESTSGKGSSFFFTVPLADLDTIERTDAA